ncbi:sigma-70 family RNA polymerase sigma factor [Microcella daejeonensis]|uniref:RNA polymerase sigma factor n=1 Tax=Microcella daejeonensis TaxID=2994971 RepID=UPI00226E890F|nr:sigma-70 family RNA polymerase sigma factor [Microcella daejeonensis]WAB83499.1 sigma-70 family RNA polymerase sigma factor [Microcella daejeonensis]
MTTATELQRRARFAALVAEVGEPVQRYLRRRIDADTAEDVLSEVLLVCWRRLDEIPVDALPWVFVVARNCLANARRAARRRERLVQRIRVVDPPEPMASVADTADGSAGASAEVADAEVRAALDRLRPAEAEVLRLWAWEELTPTQISVVLEISPNAVSIRLHRAKKALRAALLRDERRKVEPDAGHVGDDGGSR